MTNKEAIETIKIAMAEVEWNYPMDYTVAFEMAVDALEKMKELEKGLEDLEDTLNDAYTFSLKVMQNLSWLLGVIKGSDEDE